jgi:hypothetical protein
VDGIAAAYALRRASGAAFVRAGAGRRARRGIRAESTSEQGSRLPPGWRTAPAWSRGRRPPNPRARPRRCCPMPLYVRTTLLAVAALAALALAAVRITHAAEHRSIVEPPRPERSATPAQAAATLARLHAPPGFRQVATCRFAEPATAQKCFWTPRALVLDARTLERISASWPARAGVDPLLDFCSTPHRNRAGIVLGHCSWELELGPELVDAFADLLEVPSGHPTQKVAEALRYWRRGTEIRLAIIGHWPHDKAPVSALHL